MEGAKVDSVHSAAGALRVYFCENFRKLFVKPIPLKHAI